ncbi:MAG: helix-turn-helix domain-containing protein [Erysipelotrichales bacterium]|nr:helix-turn-helix domain-containing protein [Erysipelotrichales bacterium]
MKIYSVFEVCELLSVSRKTIGKYISSGELKAIKLGNQVRITEEALTRFLELKEVKVLRRPIDILNKK